MTALIAVGGTVLGAIVAAVTQMATTRATRKHQIQQLRLQQQHEVMDSLRSERRKIYAELLSTLDRVSEFERSPVIHGQSRDDLTSRRSQLRDAIDDAWRKNRELELLAGEDVSNLTYQLLTYVTKRTSLALENEELPERPKGVTYAALIRAMQLEIGFRDGKTVDSDTGKWVASKAGSNANRQRGGTNDAPPETF